MHTLTPRPRVSLFTGTLVAFVYVMQIKKEIGIRYFDAVRPPPQIQTDEVHE